MALELRKNVVLRAEPMRIYLVSYRVPHSFKATKNVIENLTLVVNDQLSFIFEILMVVSCSGSVRALVEIRYETYAIMFILVKFVAILYTTNFNL